MSDQYLAEIRIFAGNFAPAGWALCNGQLMAISQNAALFSLLGTNFGGNGTTTFGLPNLQGSIPAGFAPPPGTPPGLTPYSIGENGGEVSVTLTNTEMPAHTHAAAAGSAGKSGQAATPAANTVLSSGLAGTNIYTAQTPTPTTVVGMNLACVTPNGSGIPHANMQPYLVLNFCIALSGIFPQRQ